MIDSPDTSNYKYRVASDKPQPTVVSKSHGTAIFNQIKQELDFGQEHYLKAPSGKICGRVTKAVLYEDRVELEGQLLDTTEIMHIILFKEYYNQQP